MRFEKSILDSGVGHSNDGVENVSDVNNCWVAAAAVDVYLPELVSDKSCERTKRMYVCFWLIANKGIDQQTRVNKRSRWDGAWGPCCLRPPI